MNRPENHNETSTYPVWRDAPQTDSLIHDRLPVCVGDVVEVEGTKPGETGRSKPGWKITGTRDISSLAAELLDTTHIGYDDLDPQVGCDDPMRVVMFSDLSGEPTHFCSDNLDEEIPTRKIPIVQQKLGSPARKVDVDPDDVTLEDLRNPTRQCMLDVLGQIDQDVIKIAQEGNDGLGLPQKGLSDDFAIVACDDPDFDPAANMERLIGRYIGPGQKSRLITMYDSDTNILGQESDRGLRELFYSEDGSSLAYIFNWDAGWYDILDDMKSILRIDENIEMQCEMTVGASVLLNRTGVVEL